MTLPHLNILDATLKIGTTAHGCVDMVHYNGANYYGLKTNTLKENNNLEITFYGFQ
jgi:hypothetical protein